MNNYRDDKIRSVMAARRISISQLAEMTGLSRATLSPLCDGKAEDPKLSTLKSVADALAIPLAELFEKEQAVPA
jgi:transcriptional regulator with XRE-family HTH domain